MNFNIYIIGVGGQGIGLLSETIIRAADYAGLTVNGTDTHGLAQRGGTVTSYIRLGKNMYSPMFGKGEADMVIGMEVHEALRGMNEYLKTEGCLVYYNTIWQPLSVRLGNAKQITEEELLVEAKHHKANPYKAFDENLTDSRMQNMVLLKAIADNNLIPNIKKEHYIQALTDLMDGKMLEHNIAFFA